MNISYKHQLRIARDTLKLSDEGIAIMGGMTRTEAETFVAEARRIARGRRQTRKTTVE